MIEVLIVEDHLAQEMKITIVSRQEGSTRVLRVEEGGGRWESVPHGQTMSPTFCLQSEVGRALFDMLTRHYHGPDDARMLRRDYEAERARVDRQDELIGDVLRTLTGARAAS